MAKVYKRKKKNTVPVKDVEAKQNYTIRKLSNTVEIAPKIFIKFKNNSFSDLRKRLLKDISKEQFAVLLGKYETAGDIKIINVIDVKFAAVSDYHDQRHAFLKMKKEFIYDILAEIKKRYDADTIIDVHTHPFSKEFTSFSGVDDSDERSFCRFINDKFDDIHYASIVLSQKQYSARLWEIK
nr:Mov34/MPN/PAD-1 family protein [Clostridiales bacterium]